MPEKARNRVKSAAPTAIRIRLAVVVAASFRLTHSIDSEKVRWIIATMIASTTPAAPDSVAVMNPL